MAARDHLSKYRQKRDFDITSEPEGILAKAEGHSYLIQKHAASRLHYDFRLELDGVLKSWAVTKGPSLDPSVRRLAVEVEDHPVAYGDFEGIIPKGQYGGGTVMLWDRGSWEPVGDPHQGLKKGKLVFKLHGERLHGEWTLVRMKDREKDRGRHNWLLIKHDDEFAHEGDQDALLEKNNTSIASRRSMDKIASEADKVWKSDKAEKKKPAAKQSRVKKLPDFIKPQLATLTDAVPKGKGWLHEIKFDGYRALAYIENGAARMFTRNALDWSDKFAPLPASLAKLKVDNAILDGEVVAIDDKGITSFKMLKDALSNKGELHYYAFDLLYLNGVDVRKEPLIARKELLAEIFKKPPAHLSYSEHMTGDEEGILDNACRLGLEGLISKRADAAYHSGRAKNWLKTKCHKRQEFAIGGFTEPTHKARGIGSLLLGYHQDGEFVYAGRVGTGFDHDLSTKLRKTLDRLVQKNMAFASITADGRRGAVFVRPELVCEVEFTEWTEDGHLRHPSFQGLREDKEAGKISREKEVPVRKAVKKKPKPATKKSGAEAEVAGIRISSPDRVIYPGTDITKLELAEYYHAVSEFILPHIIDRPLSMVRCPEGSGEPCFFQRHIARGQSEYLLEAPVRIKGRMEHYLMIKNEKGLLSLAQWGVIELHPWGCKADKPELPDRIIFDLDPDPSVDFSRVIEGVKEVRARLAELGLESFIKTTGGKGLHVVAPLTRKYGWDTVKAFARAIAESMEADDPARYIATMSKAKRKGKIFVDYLRNDHTATAVAPYSARAREGATVATPLDWSEANGKLNPKEFTIGTVPTRIKKKGDVWEEMSKIRQQIKANHLKALKIKED